MKRIIISVSVVAILLIIVLIFRGSEEKSEKVIERQKDRRQRESLKLIERDGKEIERLGLAIKNLKSIPFNINQKTYEADKKGGEVGSIVGVITDENNSPFKGCIVTLSSSGTPFVAARRSDMSGKFFFDKVEVGEYRIRIQCENARTEREGILVDKDKVTNLNITVRKEERIDICIISGSVIDFVTRNPVEGAKVVFEGKNEKSSEIATDSLGRFNISVTSPQRGRIIIERDEYVRKTIDVEVNQKEIVLNNIPIVKGNISNEGGRYQGIGAALVERNGEFVVAQVFENTPAYRAGLKSGDKIIKVNGMDVNSLRLEELIALIRGDERTNVVLTIRRGDGIENLQIVRETIEIK
jgi:hypothetical protein